MIFSRILSFFLVTLGFVMAVADEEPRHQLLRKVMEDIPDHGRQLQNPTLPPDGICAAIGNQFPSGLVTCQCDVSLLATNVDYVCVWSEPVCLSSGFCGTPVYSGTINILFAYVESEICIQDLTRDDDGITTTSSPSVAPQLDVALSEGDLDFCVKLTINPRNDKFVSCSATLGRFPCDSCFPCPDGEAGVILNCLNVDDASSRHHPSNDDITNDDITPIDYLKCQPIRTVLSLISKKKITTPFVPVY